MGTCMAGTLTNVSVCRPLPCDASEAPARGSVGDCTSALASGAQCTPVCETGYVLTKNTTCTTGNLDAGECKPKLNCELIYLKQCIDQYGYWSENQQHLDYPGCEHFCNEMNLAEGIDIY